MQARLEQYANQGLMRHQNVVDFRHENQLNISGKTYIHFASNDYLGLATHPDVVAELIKGAKQFGFGSGSSVAISGYFIAQQDYEERFAEFINRESALFFNSGYHANLGVLSAIASRDNTIVSDKLCHASILDGIQLSRAKHKRYTHNNIQQAQDFLEKAKKPILVTESVFSMEGDIAAVDQLSDLAKKYSALLIVDDAHALGVLGQSGRGSSEHFNLSNDAIDYLVSPLGKAAGGVGCIVSGKRDSIDYIRQFARTYRYTTALPPAMLLGAMKALTILETEHWRRSRLRQLIQYFNDQAISRGLKLISSDITPIRSVFIGDNLLLLKMQDSLIQHGMYVGCIRPPTVPKNTARLRISLNCLHREEEIDRLLDIIAEAYAR